MLTHAENVDLLRLLELEQAPKITLESMGDPNARQAEFLALSGITYQLYGGARGGGKSWAIRRKQVGRRLMHSGSRGLLLRRTFPELRGNHILKLFRELPKGTYTYNDQKHEFMFPNGSALELGYCQTDKDVFRYQGQEYDDIGIDEVTQWQEGWFEFLTSCLRTTRTDLKPEMYLGANPGGVGHVWVKRRWIDREFVGGEQPEQYAFVPAKVYDNPAIMDADPEYVQRLEALPEDLRRAFLDGDWDVFAGQYFRELRRDIHGFDGNPPPGWTFRCLDYGESSPSAVYWCRVDRDGCIWVYRELYGAGYTYSALADKMVELSVDRLGKAEQIRYTVAPPDVFAKSKGTGIVGNEMMALRGVPCIMADNNRIEGWRRMREFLSIPPRLMVHTIACPHFWRTVPTLIHDDLHPEDVDTDSEDHAADSIRYGLATRHPVGALYGRGYDDDDEGPKKYRGRDRTTGY